MTRENNQNLFNIKDKVVVITGGFGLIGLELVSAFLESSARVVVLDLKKNSKKLTEFRKKSSHIYFYPCDITSFKSVQKALSDLARDLRKIDILVNNAYPRNKNFGRVFEKIQLADWHDNVNMHLGGYFNVTQQVVQLMIKERTGSIVNMSSIYGMVGPDFSVYKGTRMTMSAEYAAIKGGIVNLTRYLANYLAPFNIRVNAVSPGGIFNHQDQKFVKNYCKRVPLGRMGHPKDICGAIIFLASDASQYITGQNIAVDGGWTAK